MALPHSSALSLVSLPSPSLTHLLPHTPEFPFQLSLGGPLHMELPPPLPFISSEHLLCVKHWRMGQK